MQTLINTVNCVGVMGKGIALVFKQQYPAMFMDYVQRCRGKQVKLGEPYLYKVSDVRWIINFPTKGHWRNDSKIEDIERGLAYLVSHIKIWGITSLAVPPLGCGNGGLDWGKIGPLIEQHLSGCDIPIEVYSPMSYLNQQSIKTKKINHKRPHAIISTFFEQTSGGDVAESKIKSEDFAMSRIDSLYDYHPS
jgi:O-acetyl-ADP-ribose deacetylase (regulator of RNase III)